MYITLFACVSGLWLMVTRFGLPIERLITFGVISLVLLIVVICVAAFVAFLIRIISDKNK